MDGYAVCTVAAIGILLLFGAILLIGMDTRLHDWRDRHNK